MATSVIPALIDAIVAQAKAVLPNVTDGIAITDDPGDYLMVGVDNPDNDGAYTSATAVQDFVALGGLTRDESGDVHCVAESWDGNGDAKSARDAAFATCAAVENLLRGNPTLDVPGVMWTGFGSNSQLDQTQDANGAAARVSFSISFRARI